MQLWLLLTAGWGDGLDIILECLRISSKGVWHAQVCVSSKLQKRTFVPLKFNVGIKHNEPEASCGAGLSCVYTINSLCKGGFGNLSQIAGFSVTFENNAKNTLLTWSFTFKAWMWTNRIWLKIQKLYTHFPGIIMLWVIVQPAKHVDISWWMTWKLHVHCPQLLEEKSSKSFSSVFDGFDGSNFF